MSSDRDIRLLLKPIMAEDKSLAYCKRILIVSPVRHYLRMIGFYTGLDPLGIYVHVHLYPTCGPTHWRRIGIPFVNWLWPHVFYRLMDQPDYPDGFRNEIRNELIPSLKAIDSLELFRKTHDAYYEHLDGPYTEHGAFMASMFGEFDKAAGFLRMEKYFQTTTDLFNAYKPGLGDRLKKKGGGISRRDKRAIIAMLHEREEATIKSMKLDKHWEQTPFPVEEQADW